MNLSPQDTLKRAAAIRALDFVLDGMKLGLGTGSTAEAFLEVLAPRVKGGLNITAVATSERTAEKARILGIPLTSLDQLAPLDLTIDGADEADRNLNLIKGAGGALLREKLVASSSTQMVVIADGSKLVRRLGKFPLPVEVVEFGHGTTARRIMSVSAALGYPGLAATLRMKDGAPFRTDGGNVIYDCAFKAIKNAVKLGKALSDIPGVVDHGLFVGLATALVIARKKGVEVIERKHTIRK
ncbi:MAG: ribose-5-phosphate isomerase RpiA [Proteobacteria bacterium]|nr:ribose-5-phosphate isomerase RpiA [Pseudomonadota bacterium]